MASWSREEMTSSEPDGRLRMSERLEKSWVVEGPITVTQIYCQWKKRQTN